MLDLKIDFTVGGFYDFDLILCGKPGFPYADFSTVLLFGFAV